MAGILDDTRAGLEPRLKSESEGGTTVLPLAHPPWTQLEIHSNDDHVESMQPSKTVSSAESWL